MKFTASTGGIPQGFYSAEFFLIEEFDGGQNDYGAAVVLRFRVIGGKFDGQECSRVCGAKLTPKAALTKFATSLKGSPLLPHEEFDFSKFYGVKGNIHVEATESGSSRVATFIRQNESEPTTDDQLRSEVPF